MKTLAILMGLALMAICLPVQAEQLTDAEMSDIYAGQDIIINALEFLEGSAIALQSNISAIVTPESITGVSQSTNENVATVRNAGNSAAAVQSNISAAVSYGGDSIDGFGTDNYNEATVNNVFLPEDAPFENGIEASSIWFEADLLPWTFELNPVDPIFAAVASQSNIGAVVALEGGISNGYIHNHNFATVSNRPEFFTP